MEVIAAGGQVRAGETHVGQASAVGAAADGRLDGLHAASAEGRFRLVHDVHAGLQHLLHVAVAVAHLAHEGALAVLLVQVLGDALDGGLALVEFVCIVVADDVAQDGLLLIAGEVHEVVEALVALGVGGDLRGGQHAVPLDGHEQGVLHLILGAAGVDVHAVDGHLAGGGVEVLVLQLTQCAAVHGVGVVRAKTGHVEQVSAAADLLVGGEADADGAMLRGIGGHQALGQGHDLGHTGLVICAQDAVAAGDDQLLTRERRQELEAVDDHAVLQRDGLAVVVRDAHRLGRAADAVGGVHVGDKADLGRVVALGGDGGVDIAVLVHTGVGDAHRLQLVYQHFGQHQLVGAGGTGLTGFFTGGLHLHIAQEFFLHGHVERSSISSLISTWFHPAAAYPLPGAAAAPSPNV